MTHDPESSSLGQPEDESSGDEPLVLSDEELAGHLVAILFAADEPLPLADLARLLEIRLGVMRRVAALVAEYPPAGLLLQRDEDRLQLVTAQASARYIRRLRGLEDHSRLSRAALEVLAVIAYRQPVTRAEVEAIRGVNGDRALATLIARGLVAEAGRRETVGRPVLFATTLGFLEHLGLGSLDDLPPVAATAASDSPAEAPPTQASGGSA
ncbi:MAG: SMC-Scp complex subunit ScpB [Chloroflexota bacterium]